MRFPSEGTLLTQSFALLVSLYKVLWDLLRDWHRSINHVTVNLPVHPTAREKALLHPKNSSNSLYKCHSVGLRLILATEMHRQFIISWKYSWGRLKMELVSLYLWKPGLSTAVGSTWTECPWGRKAKEDREMGHDDPWRKYKYSCLCCPLHLKKSWPPYRKFKNWPTCGLPEASWVQLTVLQFVLHFLNSKKACIQLDFPIST